jgi:hypothetical protein
VAIAATDIVAIQKAMDARIPLLSHPSSERPAHAPHAQSLTGTDDVLAQSDPAKGFLILSIELSQHSSRGRVCEVECVRRVVAYIGHATIQGLPQDGVPGLATADSEGLNAYVKLGLSWVNCSLGLHCGAWRNGRGNLK